MLLFVVIWGVAHLVANGEMAALLLFGSFTVFSLFKMWSLTKRNPPAPKPAVAIARDIVALGISALVYSCIVYFHADIAGVPLL